MNYDKLTKNSGIKKSEKKDVKRRLRAEGVKVGSGEMIKITDDYVLVPTSLSKKKEKKYEKFVRELKKDWEKELHVLTNFLLWFMDTHEITHLPDLPNEDEYVELAWFIFLRFVCFPKNPIFSENLRAYEDPEWRKVVTPLKYQSEDLLEVA